MNCISSRIVLSVLSNAEIDSPNYVVTRRRFAGRLFFRTLKSRPHGHPNRSRKQYVLLGGNPTADIDAWEIKEYPVGIQPDPHFNPDNLISNLKTIDGTSANGCAEYTLPGPLQGRLLTCFCIGTHTIHTFAFNTAGTAVTDHQPLLSVDIESLRTLWTLQRTPAVESMWPIWETGIPLAVAAPYGCLMKSNAEPMGG